MDPILELEQVELAYGPVRALRGISLRVGRDETVALLGPNAAGKTSTLRAIMGLAALNAGRIQLAGARIDGMSTPDIVGRGVALVPENRRLFGSLSVYDNLMLGAYRRSDRHLIRDDLDSLLELFPRLRERLRQAAGTLSGGEQQMVAMARALICRPSLLLLDEPSMGLAPVLVERVFEHISEIRRLGTAILLVEQNAHMALHVASRGYVLRGGRVVLEGAPKSLLDSDALHRAYLALDGSADAPRRVTTGPQGD